MDGRSPAAPLTDFQRALLAILAPAGKDGRYLAGEAALHFAPNSARSSDGLDFFHDSFAGVASTFAADRSRLVEILFAHERILPLTGLCWAEVGKDPGFTPLSLLELLKRRGRHRPEAFERLHLARPLDLVASKEAWLAALAHAETCGRGRRRRESCREPINRRSQIRHCSMVGNYCQFQREHRTAKTIVDHFS